VSRSALLATGRAATVAGRAPGTETERIPPAVIARLGIPIEDLESLHAALTRVIAAAR
jgi:MarR family transcriptional regulator, organic hydroperoxide resistance regulator